MLEPHPILEQEPTQPELDPMLPEPAAMAVHTVATPVTVAPTLDQALVTPTAPQLPMEPAQEQLVMQEEVEQAPMEGVVGVL